MNIWKWLHESIQDGLDRNDESRLELYWIYRDAMDLNETNPEAAFAALEEGRRRAHALGEGWWTLFFEHWKLQNLLHKQRDYARARELASRVALEARKPAYAALPQRVCLQEDLISSFVGIDARGHAHLIEDALAFMEREAPRDAECYLCLQGLKTEFLAECGRHDEALTAGRRAIAESERANNEHHVFQELLMQCELELDAPYEPEQMLDTSKLQEGDPAVPVENGWVAPETFEARVAEVEAMARRAQEIAHKMDEHEFDPEIEMWLAHTGFMLGRDDADAHFKRAIDTFFDNGRLPSSYFFRAWMMTYWRLGSPEQALKLVQNEGKWIEGNGQLAREARLARQECHFKLALGTLEADDIERARAKIALLKAPDYEAGRLTELEAVWQQQQN